MIDFPIWLSSKNAYIAQKLLSHDFCYIGNLIDFCEGYLIEEIDDWQIYFSYGQITLEAVCDDALFCFDLETSPITSEEALNQVRELIKSASHNWEHNSTIHNQLLIF